MRTTIPFTAYLVASIIGSLVYGGITQRIPNIGLLRCTACGSIFYIRPKGYWRTVLRQFIWFTVAWVTVWRIGPPPTSAILLLVVMNIAWYMAADRVRRAFWLYKHPIRCQGGGHYMTERAYSRI